jgi:hypothetical protein
MRARPLHVALERDHARAHQAVLQLGDGARLLGQQVLRVLGQRLEQLLDAADVVGGFGQRARELLDRGITVELERIELAARALLFLVTMQDLRLGLELELAQLLLQARHRARQLADVEVDGADLLLEARARDARFAGVVEQLVQQLGVDTRELRTIGRGRGLTARRHRARRQQRRVRGVGVLGEARGRRILGRGTCDERDRFDVMRPRGPRRAASPSLLSVPRRER